MKNPFAKNNLLLTAPVIFVMILDFIFTLISQPSYYWLDFRFFNGIGSLGQTLMLHPFYFVIFFIFYVLFVITLIGILPRPLNIMAAISFYLGHVWGSSAWLGPVYYRIFGSSSYTWNQSWYLNVGYFVFIAIVSGIFISWWFRNYEKSRQVQ